MRIMRTLLFTDLVDSTQLVERLGDEAAAATWAEHDRLARQLLVQHCGHEIDRTDGFFLLFDAVLDAAHFALAYHAAIVDLQLSARVGMHVGAVTLRANAAADVARGAKPVEVEGLAKPYAARIMGLAHGGQTLLSPGARLALAETLPAGAQIEAHGHYRLKGIEEPVAIFELGHAGSSFTPPADTDKVYRVVRVDDLWQPLRSIRHNLAPERDAFIGRSSELRTLAQLLDHGARQLTVLGPGGTGKTRLVRRYAMSRLGDWPGGVYFCDLSEARSLDGIYFAVAFALGVPLGKDDPALQLGHAIAGRGRCLMVLDNFEQVAQHARATLGRWLDRAAETAFIATSRELLHLPGETVFPVEPLPLDKEAIELFTARAQAQRPDFTIGDHSRAAVAELVRLLDGLPLAIELAAARIRVFSPGQIVARLKDRFQLLAGAGGAAARQTTLRAAIDWSWELLVPWEQAALAQCSVFEGGFTMEAAEAVLDLSPWPDAPPPVDAVQALLHKSLLRTWRPFGQFRLDVDEPYFGMYLSIHDYAADRLARWGNDAALQAQVRHGLHFANFGSDKGMQALARHGAVRLSRGLALEIDNLVVACRRAVARGEGDSAAANLRAAWAVFDLKGPLGLATELAREVLAMEGLSPSARARALATQARVDWRAGRMDEATAEFEQALRLYEQTADGPDASGALRSAGNVLNGLGLLRHERGQDELSQQCWDRALAIARELGDLGLQASVLGHFGLLYWKQGRPTEARDHWAAAAAMHRDMGNPASEAVTLGNLAMLLDERSQVDAAMVLYEQAMLLHREVGNHRFEAVVFCNVGCLHATQKRWAQAQENFTAALAIYREVGDRRGEGMVLGNQGTLDLDLGRIAQAGRGLQAALLISREVGNREQEGSLLGGIASVLLAQGQTGPARQAVADGERVLRELGHRLELAELLCVRGRLEVALGNPQAARAVLDEAKAIAAALDMPEQSSLGAAIIRLHDALT